MLIDDVYLRPSEEVSIQTVHKRLSLVNKTCAKFMAGLLSYASSADKLVNYGPLLR